MFLISVLCYVTWPQGSLCHTLSGYLMLRAGVICYLIDLMLSCLLFWHLLSPYRMLSYVILWWLVCSYLVLSCLMLCDASSGYPIISYVI